MKNTQIEFYDQTGSKIVVKLKKFISANMIVEITKILKKYATTYDGFIKNISLPEYEIMNEPELEFIRAKKYLEYALARDKDKPINIFEDIYFLYADEINKEIIPLIVDISSITNKKIIDMLKDTTNDLWMEQDLNSFREICSEFYQ